MAGPLTPLPAHPAAPPPPPGNRRRLVFVTFLAVLFVLGAMAVRLALTPPPEPPTPPPASPTAQAQAATPTVTESATVAALPPTATTTRVQVSPSHTPTRVPPLPTLTPTSGPSATATWTPAWAPPTRTATAAPATTAPPATVSPAATGLRPTPIPRDTERVRNGDFEAGFSAAGVAMDWTHFSNGSAAVSFGDENSPPAVYDSFHAQLIRIEGATQPDRYAGIYQVVDVVPGATYRLSVHGLIRSAAGDVARSEYGYRLQVGLDLSGGQDWQGVTEWIELPADEQPFDAFEFAYGRYEQSVQTTGPRLTLFIRAWHKWADPARADYAIDGVSLIGPAPAE